MGKTYTFNGKRGNLEPQLERMGHPFTINCDAARDNIVCEIEKTGPMTIVVTHSEQASGRFVRMLRDHADGSFCIDEKLTVVLN